MSKVWDKNLNLFSYEGVEAEENFLNKEMLEGYRELLFKKSQPAVDCIRKICYDGQPLNALELCSGSSRLLFALDRLGLIAHATGVEVSTTRHRFAENWKKDFSLSHVENVLCSVDKYAFDSEELDLVAIIDAGLSYLYPFDPNLPEMVFKRIYKKLKLGGKLILELDVLSNSQRTSLLQSGVYRVWRYGDDKDAFGYALYETKAINWDEMVFQNHSIYINRTTRGESVKCEIHKYYESKELGDILERIGFKVNHFGSFFLEPFTPDSKTLVTVAEKY